MGKADDLGAYSLQHRRRAGRFMRSGGDGENSPLGNIAAITSTPACIANYHAGMPGSRGVQRASPGKIVSTVLRATDGHIESVIPGQQRKGRQPVPRLGFRSLLIEQALKTQL